MSSQALLKSFFEKEGDKLIPNADMGKYLSDELGWTLLQKQEASIGTAIEKPKDFLDQREKNVKKFIDETVKEAYANSVKTLVDIGLPEETIKTMSLRHAKTVFDQQMELEELRHPGYSRAIGTFNANRDRMEDRFSKDEKRAIKSKAIEKYKAKKRAKKAGAQTA